jgi:hypothetical protein
VKLDAGPPRKLRATPVVKPAWERSADLAQQLHEKSLAAVFPGDKETGDRPHLLIIDRLPDPGASQRHKFLARGDGTPGNGAAILSRAECPAAFPLRPVPAWQPCSLPLSPDQKTARSRRHDMHQHPPQAPRPPKSVSKSAQFFVVRGAKASSAHMKILRDKMSPFRCHHSPHV